MTTNKSMQPNGCVCQVQPNGFKFLESSLFPSSRLPPPSPQTNHSIQLSPDADLDDERHVERGGGFHFAFNDLASTSHLSLGPFEKQFVVDLHDHLGFELFAFFRESATRIIAILTMSLAVPWIGMLIASRSARERTAKLRSLIDGK